MTTGRYIMARIAQSFGISRRTKRMSDAAFETHLLREAEQILGHEVWEDAEQVDDVSVEYWNLRKLERQRVELADKLARAEKILAEAHDERARLLNESTDAQQDLEQQRYDLSKELEAIARERDEVVALAKEVRRQYEGLKTKLAVLAEEQGDHVAAQTTQANERMHQLRSDFQLLKKRRTEIGHRLEDGDRRLSAVEAKLGDRRQVRREEASQTFQVIGRANREISNYRAELGLIETQQQQLFGELGRYVSRHARVNPDLAKIYRKRQGLIDIMTALRRSIIMNRKLSGV